MTLTKQLVSDMHFNNPVHVLGFDYQIDVAMEQAIEEIVCLFGESSEVMLLGRNNFDIDIFVGSEFFEIQKNSKDVRLVYSKYPKLQIIFLTVHRSKGLEADNVIVINLCNKLIGFPNKISDDPLLSLVLTDKDEFSYAEERRLFYVAITRTKNITYLIVPDSNKSIFVDELMQYNDINYVMSSNERSIQDNPNCPKCKKGFLVFRENPLTHDKFLGCSNYPLCDETINDIDVLESKIVCTTCGGFMTKRRSKFGTFFGCTNYPYCKNTIKLEEPNIVENNDKHIHIVDKNNQNKMQLIKEKEATLGKLNNNVSAKSVSKRLVQQDAFTEEEILEEMERISTLETEAAYEDTIAKKTIYERRGTNEEKEHAKLKSDYNNIRDWMYYPLWKYYRRLINEVYWDRFSMDI